MSPRRNCNVINDDKNDKFHVDMDDHNGIFGDDSCDFSIYRDDTNDDAVLEVRKLFDSAHSFTVKLLKKGVPDEEIHDELQKHLESRIILLLHRERIYGYHN
ncbi:hypothetical protein Focb16_v006063 [Fusarium oxysporum f. sp. cubense]|uniref:Uncharacterized protein n=1 Tax=Fusarium oxysporum f. sp. cubense TaxID=61366 RepID=A0A559LJR3_FUSOC|nr:hypothetical protein Focb16_v005897 [Fusarium oxysporum f. sp. cubense]TVY74512.1 hypothetical protein Focb16_v006063 [Fusarium oxysporum f. sp. cubense]